MSEKTAKTTKIIQGEFAVGRDPDERISTLLGSCVSVCLWDEVAGIGGMNHMLLPDGLGVELRAASVGASAMELLINALLQEGARKSRFKAKLFGGAAMVSGLSDIGARNGNFAHDYLERESIPVIAESLGGTEARQIRFWPTNGRVQMRSVANETVVEPTVSRKPEANGVELF